MTVLIRPAVATDASFLERMFVVADSWREDVVPDVDPAQHADVWHYVEDWPRPDDFGVVAEDDGAPVGAAWARFFTPERPGYGFVDAIIPEIAIGVEPTHRGQGVGRRLIDALIEQARDRQLAGISLSVEEENHRAQGLYASMGFVTVDHHPQEGYTMVLTLDA